LADYDGDGRLDLLSGANCCQWPFGFYVFRRRPDGTFAPRKHVNLRFPPGQFDGFNLPVGGLPGQTRVAVADWDGDGVPDLLVLVPTRTLGIVYGPLKDKDELTVGRLWPKGSDSSAVADSTSFCVADWDGDGLPDLVLGCRSGVYWMRNVGTRRKPQLGPARLLVADEGSGVTGIAVADWDGDGRADLVLSRMEYRKTARGLQPQHHRVWVHLRKRR
jgi:hypothetical protein